MNTYQKIREAMSDVLEPPLCLVCHWEVDTNVNYICNIKTGWYQHEECYAATNDKPPIDIPLEEWKE